MQTPEGCSSYLPKAIIYRRRPQPPRDPDTSPLRSETRSLSARCKVPCLALALALAALHDLRPGGRISQ